IEACATPDPNALTDVRGTDAPLDPNDPYGPLPDGGKRLPDGAQVVTTATDPTVAVPFSDDEAVAWLVRECSSCHGVDENGNPALYVSYWAMPPNFSRHTLEIDSDTADVYQTLSYRYQAKGDSIPLPMPPLDTKYDNQKNAELARAIAWFRKAQP